MLAITALTLCMLCVTSIAKALEHGEKCDPKPKYKKSWQYEDSCDNVHLYCEPSTSTCQYKGCANTDYIPGWDISFRPFPERCNGTMFCPDNQSKCTEKAPIGSYCEIQRDDECATVNSICLNSTCFVKGAPLGGNCGVDITTYVTFDAAGAEMEQTIIRDNCTEGLYCDNAQSYTCILSKENGLACDQDRECLSGTCSNEGMCVNGPDIFHQIPTWSWGLVALGIILFILIVLSGLWVLHRYQSNREHRKMIKFFDDNEEFGKYATSLLMSQQNNDSMSALRYHDNNVSNLSVATSTHDIYSQQQQYPQGLIYLTTPDYYTSQALSRKKGGAPPSNENASMSSISNPFQSTFSISNLSLVSNTNVSHLTENQ